MSKKGVSQKVATVLLIGFVIALMILVFLWARHYIQERAAKEGKLAESKLRCHSIDFRITNAYQKASEVYVVIENKGNIGLSKFTFRLHGNQVQAKESYKELNEFEVKEYIIPFAEDELGKIDKVETIPWIEVIRSYSIPCSEKSISYNVKPI